jgi:hypothetical protein
LRRKLSLSGLEPVLILTCLSLALGKPFGRAEVGTEMKLVSTPSSSSKSRSGMEAMEQMEIFWDCREGSWFP